MTYENYYLRMSKINPTSHFILAHRNTLKLKLETIINEMVLKKT